MANNGFIVSSLASDSGKTTITLAIIASLVKQGYNVSSGKTGPDYIDGKYHEYASGKPCFNFDTNLMRADYLKEQYERIQSSSDIVIIEGVMGLYDGTDNGAGSTASLAKLLDLPVVIVVNPKGMIQSVGTIIKAIKSYDNEIKIAGVILNNIVSKRHKELIYQSLNGINTFGFMSKMDASIKSRHLGLVQAMEHACMEHACMEHACMEHTGVEHTSMKSIKDSLCQEANKNINFDLLLQQTRITSTSHLYNNVNKLPPLGQNIAIAKDLAFSFIYNHILLGWQEQGANIMLFSPLDNDPIPNSVNAIYLAGGYPENYLLQLTSSNIFIKSLQTHSEKGTLIYGECGGFMVLGDGIYDKDSKYYEMAGLLPMKSYFNTKKLKLRMLELEHDSILPWVGNLKGHEFHYSDIRINKDATNIKPLFKDKKHKHMGMQKKNVMGSFAHIVDLA